MADQCSQVPDGTIRRARGGKSPTIYDIARIAHVNPSTVSRALSQPGRINSKTEERIRATAKELNYRVNPIARALPTGRTNTLGLVVADITNPVIFDIVRGAERAAADAGYTLVVAESQESGEREATAIERVLPSIDGLVLATTRLGDAQIIELSERKPIIVLNRAVDGLASIFPDVEHGVEQLVGHLATLGHRSIAYLSGPDTSWISSRRWAALVSAASRRNMSIVEIGPGLPTLEGGAAAITRTLASGVTVAVAFNDLMAIGLLRAAAGLGIVVPTALSIAGFDDIFGSDLTTPGITTVRAPLEDGGARAVHLLLDRVSVHPKRSAAAQAAVLLPTSLLVRGSTGRPAS